jgi:hypothetical protein
LSSAAYFQDLPESWFLAGLPLKTVIELTENLIVVFLEDEGSLVQAVSDGRQVRWVHSTIRIGHP